MSQNDSETPEVAKPDPSLQQGSAGEGTHPEQGHAGLDSAGGAAAGAPAAGTPAAGRSTPGTTAPDRQGMTVQLPPLPVDRRATPSHGTVQPPPQAADRTVRIQHPHGDRPATPTATGSPPNHPPMPTRAPAAPTPPVSEDATRITSFVTQGTGDQGAPATGRADASMLPSDGATVVSRLQPGAGQPGAGQPGAGQPTAPPPTSAASSPGPTGPGLPSTHAPQSPTDQFSRPFAQSAAGSQHPLSSHVSPPAAHSGPLPVDGLIAGRYRVKKVLGVGGMGEVYHVADEVLEIEVALKVMRSEVATDTSFLQRFRNELLVARQITHPHVVRIHDIGQDGSLLFMTMDLVEGRSLGDLMKEGPIEIPAALRIIRQVADALGAAHRKFVVHRDLKPANILLDARGDAFVTDFGIARSHSFSGLTRTGEVLGTPDYLAPEQARGEAVDGRTDLYALGLIFFEMVTGERPFTGGTLVEIIAQHMTGQTRSFNDVAVAIDPGLQAVIRRCMEVVPDERYADAEALLADLEDLEKPRRRAAEQEQKKKAKKAAKVAAVAAVLGIVTAGGWWLWDNLKPIPTQEIEIVVPAEAPVELQPMPAWLILPLPEDGEEGVSNLDAWAGWGVPQTLADMALDSGQGQVIDRARLLHVIDNLGLDSQRLSDADVGLLRGLFGAQKVVLGSLEAADDSFSLNLETRDAEGNSEVLFAGQGATIAELARGASEALAGRLGSSSPQPAALLGNAEAADLYTAGRLKMERDPEAAEVDLRAAVTAAPELNAGWLGLAQLQSSQDRTTEATESLAKALEALPAGIAGERLGFQARRLSALLEQDPETAHQELERWVEGMPGDTEARFQLANSYGQLGQIDRALETLEVLSRLDPSDSRVWYFLGRYSIVSGDPGRAVDDYLVEASAAARRANDRPAEAQIANALGIGYQHLGKLEQASRRFEEAAGIQESIGDRAGYAKALLNLGRLSTNMNQAAQAEEQLRDALTTFEELRDTSGQADAVNAIGVLRENQGNYSGALQEYRQALRLRLDSGQRLAAAESYHNLGFVHLQMANYIDAALNLEQALDIYTELGNTYGSMVVMQTRAGADIARGHWGQAASDLLAALATSRELQVPLARAASHGDLARLARLEGRYSDALKDLDQAIQIVDEQENVRGQVEFTLARAQTLLELGNAQDAELLLNRVEELFGDAGSDSQRAQWRYLEGLLLQRQGNNEEAANSLAEALKHAESSRNVTAGLQARLAVAAGAAQVDSTELEDILTAGRNLGHVALELQTAEALARVYLEQGRPEAADDPLRRALAMVRKVGDYQRSFHLHRLLAQVLESRGDATGAGHAMTAADAEYQRVLAGVPNDLRAGFETVQGPPAADEPAAETPQP